MGRHPLACTYVSVVTVYNFNQCHPCDNLLCFIAMARKEGSPYPWPPLNKLNGNSFHDLLFSPLPPTLSRKANERKTKEYFL